jgi:katanin p80 WD40 repeat-containing subunit B1
MARAREDRAREPAGGSTPAARDDARVATPGVGAFRETGADRAAEFPLDDKRLRGAEFPLDDERLRGASPVTPGRRDPRAEPSPSSVAASPGAGPLGLDFADFVPGAANPRASPSPSRPVADESVVLARMEAPDGGVVAGILSARLASLRAAKARWTRNDPRGVAETLARAGDASAIVDVLAAILDGAARAKGLSGLASRAEPPLTLDVACCMTPLAASVVRSPHATYADAAIRFARLVATSFGEVVRDASGSPGSIGVDVEGEERARKAGVIRNALGSMVDAREEIGGGGGELAPRARELGGFLAGM